MTVFACLASTAALAGQPPVEAFGSLPAISDPCLSPDGKFFAVVQPVEGRPVVTIHAIGAPAGTKPTYITAGDGRVATILWAKNDRLIVILKSNIKVIGSDRVRTWWRSISVDPHGQNAVVLLRNVKALRFNAAAAYVSDVDLDDDDHVFMPLLATNLNGSVVMNLYKVDVYTGSASVAQSGSLWTVDWIMDGKGRVVATTEIYARELKYHVKLPAGGENWRDIGSFDLTPGGEARVAGVTEDGKALAMELPTPKGRIGLYRMDLATEAKSPLFTDDSYDVSYEVRDDWTGRVIGVGYIADRMEYRYFDPARQRLQSALERAFPEQSVRIASCDLGPRLCIVETNGPRAPTHYFLVDAVKLKAASLGSAYPDLTSADLGETRSYAYVARDGVRIPAYLTLPPGKPANDLPVVVMPHGGPELRDMIGFDWWVQFLANRGYAVLQPNYRGSAGYGEAFEAAGNREWGAKVETDLADGVAKLVADGIADPKRVCIVGASYGGYAALAGAAFTPGVYACAVSVAGISDLEEWLRTQERWSGSDSVTMAFYQARLGSRSVPEDLARMRAVSPALHADRIDVPVLLMHATGDSTVPIGQSKEMRDALEDAHKDVAYIALDGDDHYLDLAETRIRVLSEIEKFLAAHIGR